SGWQLSPPLLRMIGSLELLAVLGLLAGLVFLPLGIAAAAGLVLLMIGAIAYHLQAREALLTLLFPAVPLLLSATTLVVGVAAL
ncbi:MAG: DoxX family protein, partial [Pseudonocardiaceae bacterium]